MRIQRLFMVCLLLAACSERDSTDSGTADSGTVVDSGPRDSALEDTEPGSDAGVPADAGDDAVLPDGGDADASVDASTDATTDAAVDAGRVDTGSPDAGRDSAVPGAGECDLTSPLCDTMCFRAVFCVMMCGGPRTSCGCCPCAAGSIDDIICPPDIDTE